MNKDLRLHDIRKDDSAQPRATLNTDHIKDLADALEDSGNLTPVDVFYDGRSYWLADGFHRWSAYHRAKRDFIPATIHEGDLRAAILHGITANNQHGVLKLTREEKRASVVKLLKDEEWGQWPQGQIAKTAGVSRVYVNRLWQEVKPEATCERLQVKGADGRTINTAKIGKPNADPPQAPPQPEKPTTDLSEYTQPRHVHTYSPPPLPEPEPEPDAPEEDEMLDELVSGEPEDDTDLEPYRPPYPIPPAGDVRVKPDDPSKRRPFMQAFTAAGALSNLSDDVIVAGLLSPENQSPEKDALDLELSVVIEKINRCQARAELERATLTVQS